MIADALAKIQALEQTLTGKTAVQLNTRLTIRACLKELREISAPCQVVTPEPATQVVSLSRRVAS